MARKRDFGTRYGEAEKRADHRDCRYCGQPKCHRHGVTSAGSQRYRCQACGRTHTIPTRQPRLSVRLQKQWKQYMRTVHRVRPVRHDATRLGVAPSTVWRWRHLYLSTLRAQQASRPSQLTGRVLISTRTFHHALSHWRGPLRLTWDQWRGRRPLRPPSSDRVHIHFMTDLRRGQVTHARVVPSRGEFPTNPLPQEVMQHLRVGAHVGLAHRSRIEELTRSLNRNGPSFQLLAPEHTSVHIYHEQLKANAQLRGLFQSWMSRFHGVRMRYIDRYTSWFQALLDRRLVRFTPYIYPALSGLAPPGMAEAV